MKALAIFWGALIAGLSGAMMPGPVLALVVSETSRRGFWASPEIVSGHAALELLLVVALLVGLRRYLQSMAAFVALGLVGGAMLLWMAWGMVGFGLSGPKIETTAIAGPIRNAFLAGAIVSLANPYWSVWWATVGAGFLQRAAAAGTAATGLFFVGHISSDYLWYAVVGWIVAVNKRLLVGAAYQWLLFGCAALIGAMGIYFVLSAVRALVKRQSAVVSSQLAVDGTDGDGSR
jgi:threonine/homoserine/homoserine lactone efflux protein